MKFAILKILVILYILASFFVGSTSGAIAHSLSKNSKYTRGESMAIGVAHAITHGTVVKIAFNLSYAYLNSHKSQIKEFLDKHSN